MAEATRIKQRILPDSRQELERSGGTAEIKQMSNQYLHIVISDNDILEFIEEVDLDKVSDIFFG